MIVFDLQCSARHLFEGWFASEQDFQQQCQRAMLLCPLCGDSSVNKRLSAPRLNLATHGRSQPSSSPSSDVKVDGIEKDLQQAWLDAAKKIVADTEDVGPNFSREARRIHYGETAERGIRGYATVAETASLLEEGIAVMPLVMPEGLKNTLQ